MKSLKCSIDLDGVPPDVSSQRSFFLLTHVTEKLILIAYSRHLNNLNVINHIFKTFILSKILPFHNNHCYHDHDNFQLIKSFSRSLKPLKSFYRYNINNYMYTCLMGFHSTCRIPKLVANERHSLVPFLGFLPTYA